MLTDSQSFVVNAFIQVLLYGIYLATLIQCFRWLIFTEEGWKPRPWKQINAVMTLTTIFIFLMFTINLVTPLVWNMKVYFTRDVDESWFHYGTVMMMNISECLAKISIDGALVYRCWVVYAKSWRVICVPVTFWLASLACLAVQVYYIDLNHKEQIPSFDNAEIERKAIISLFTCNIAITIYTTTAIIYRILSSARSGGGNRKRLNYVIRILAESGVLYTSMTIFSVVGATLTVRADSTWVELFISGTSDTMAFSTGGISFNLLLIRVYQSRVELRDSFADSGNVYVERSLSQIQFNDRQNTSPPEGSSSNALDEVVEEIRERRREGMHEN